MKGYRVKVTRAFVRYEVVGADSEEEARSVVLRLTQEDDDFIARGEWSEEDGFQVSEVSEMKLPTTSLKGGMMIVWCGVRSAMERQQPTSLKKKFSG